MPTRQPKSRVRASRCSYTEGGRRCARNASAGTNPPLCATCQIAVQELARASQRTPPQRLADLIGDFLAGKPINQEDALGVARDMFVEWGGIGAEYRPPINAHGRTAHGRTAPFVPFGGWPFQGPNGAEPAQRPPVDPQEAARQEEIRRSREVFGFTAKEPLNEVMIKDRRNQLALKNHPDRGGSVDMMTRINVAADVLLASLDQVIG